MKSFLVIFDIVTICDHNQPWSNHTFSFLFLVGDFIFTNVLLISFCELPASSGGLYLYLKNKAGLNKQLFLSTKLSKVYVETI